MTKERAIEILERRTTIPDAECTWEQTNQAIDTAISALRSVSREQVEMAWRGEWGIGGTEMTDREKMIDLIINAKKSDPETGSFTEYLADFLLGYGIKLPDPTPQPGNPLTLEQLREMDGQPVWIVEYPDWGHWELSEDANDYIVDRNLTFYGMKHDDPDGRYGLHKLGWLAYSYPPAQQRWIKEANMPPTNGDHIRAMDDKELSDWICSIMTSECCDRTCPGREFCEFGHQGLLDWLQAIYKEEN